MQDTLPTPISRKREMELYNMGYQDSRQLDRKGHVVEADPERYTTNEYKAYVMGWNAYLETQGKQGDK